MPSRINHVKIVTSHPEVVNAFLTTVCDMPEGWQLGEVAELPIGAALGPGGDLPERVVGQWRGVTGGGYLVGDAASRQLQLLRSSRSAVWAICISTSDVEGVYARARARAIPCTPITVAD